MRGKGLKNGKQRTLYGITPAYAGKRSASRGHVEAVRDHPRLCGEKSSIRHDGVIPPGSPPPMRGKAWLCFLRSYMLRITPAYAGKSKQFNVLLGTA